ncbi:hypothetical protein NQZ68_021784 [Dissostichus eleginoides]|nr:hypothetical protein NQZ68_021784 [Dissostichus eleginoides]
MLHKGKQNHRAEWRHMEESKMAKIHKCRRNEVLFSFGRGRRKCDEGKCLKAEGYGESPSDCAQRLQLIPSPHRIGSPPADPPHNRPIPQCIDFCHFLPNPDGISAGREDLLEPAERRLPVRGRAETPPYVPHCFMLQELFFDVSS